MQTFYSEPDWLRIVQEQERLLRYPAFERAAALTLGGLIVEAVEQRGLAHAAIAVVEDNMTVFAYKMPGATLENDLWMRRKQNVSLLTGTSSLRAYLEAEAGLREPFWARREANYAPCGGCFPVFAEGEGAPFAYALVSGMEHYEDHQVIADAMARQLGVAVGPTLPR